MNSTSLSDRRLICRSVIYMSESSKAPKLAFLLLCTVSLLPFWPSLRSLAALAIHDRRYSQILVIPLVSACLIYWKRQDIFRGARWCPALGAPLLCAGAAFYFLAVSLRLNPAEGLCLAAFAIVVTWMAGFVCCYGPQSFKAALFPLLFLLLLVPVPGGLLDGVISLLQKGSSEIVDFLFNVLGVPVFQDGYRFSLPGLTIEVAKECSSIRSATALFITGMVAGYLVIRSPWRRASLCAVTIPIAMFTNAVRIVTLSWLAIHVDRGFLYGNLHRRGGALFSLISVAILLLALFVLSENRLRGRCSVSHG